MTVLSDELQNDPEGIGYSEFITSGNNQKLVELLNEPRTEKTKVVSVSSSKLLMWGGQKGRLKKLENASNNTNLSDETRSIADAALRMIQREDTELDMSDSFVVGMIDSLISSEILTSEDKTELEQMTKAMVSRAQELDLGVVSINEVRNATT